MCVIESVCRTVHKCGWVIVSVYVFEPVGVTFLFLFFLFCTCALFFSRILISRCMGASLCACVYVHACILPTHNLSLTKLWCLKQPISWMKGWGPRGTCRIQPMLEILPLETCRLLRRAHVPYFFFLLKLSSWRLHVIRRYHSGILGCIASGRIGTTRADPLSNAC